MKALSIRQPWAWLVAQGYKDIENRTWATQFTGPFLIHAGKSMEQDIPYTEELCNRLGIILPSQYDRGGFVGVANITGCVTNSKSPWFGGPFGFLISDARPIPFYPYRGLLKLWEVSDFVPPEPSVDFQPLAQTAPPKVKGLRRKRFFGFPLGKK